MKLFFATLALLFSIAVVSHASDVFVSPGGTGTACSTSTPCSVATGVSQVTIPGIVHFKDGTYPNITISKGGTSTTSRLVYQCDNGVASAIAANGHCMFTGSQFAWTGGGTANNYDIRGFDIGNNPNMTVGYDGLYCGSATQSTCNNSVHIIGNYFHDFAQNAPVDSNGCILLGFSPGAILILNQHNHFVTDTQVIGNFITRAGPLPKSQCNTGTNGMYIDTKGAILQNNLIVQVHNWGMQVFGEDCDQIVSNNTIITAHFGMNTTGGGEGVCTSGHNTIANQIIMNTLSNKIWGLIGCDSTHPNLVSHVITDGIGADFDRTQNSCTAITPNPLVHASGTSVFVNYQTDGTGDYHLKSSGAAVGTGSGPNTCASGAATPCVPSTDIIGIIRPNPPSAGAFEFASSSGSGIATANPTSLTFPSEPVGTPSPAQTVTVGNSGTGPYTLNQWTTANGSFTLDATTTTCINGESIAVGFTCKIGVIFNPIGLGARSDNLIIPSTASNTPLSVPLSGTGTTVGTISATLTPTSFDFGSSLVGTSTTEHLFTYTSTGSSSVTIGTQTIGGANPGDFFFGAGAVCANGQSVSSGASCNISVLFNPTATGVRSATLTVTDNSSGSPHTVTLTGTGTSSAPAITLSQPSATFGNTSVNSSATGPTVTVTNSGNANLVISLAGGVDATNWAVNTDGSCLSPITPGGTCFFIPFFTPTSVGAKSTTYTITANTTPTTTTFALSGTAVQSNLSVSPASLTFSDTPVGSNSIVKTFTLTNNSSTGPAVLTFNVTGPYGQTNNCGTTLAPSASCTVSVTFSPLSNGSLPGTVAMTVPDGGPNPTVSLLGNGIIPTNGVLIIGGVKVIVGVQILK